jgi:hypothetical protein
VTGLAVLVPVLRRPHRVKPLLESFAAVTPEPFSVCFICDGDDHGEQQAVVAAGGKPVIHGGSYAAKIHYGVSLTSEPLIFAAADDLTPQPGWFEAAMTYIDEGFEIVGVNDLIERRPGREGHATHFLMTRAYAERETIDGGPGPFHQGYGHNFCDDELIATAKRRGVYAYAENSHVRHDHPMAGAPDDETYRKGRAQFARDRRLFLRRQRLWT